MAWSHIEENTVKINKIIYESLQEGMRPIGGPRAKSGKTRFLKVYEQCD